jgi:SEC-C motif domain protein
MSEAMMSEQACPCDPRRAYADCCEPYHDHKAFPETAEALMRSRYSAYALAGKTPSLIHYLVSTHDPQTFRQGEDEIRAMQAWAEVVHFTALEVLSTFAGQPRDKVGKVTFKAHYYEYDSVQKPLVLQEKSRFRRYRGRWVYIDGEIQP